MIHFPEMKYTQFTFIKLGLKAMPLLTAMGGAVAAYFWAATNASNLDDWEFTKHITLYVTIGGAMGMLGGMALSLFGQAALHRVVVEDDPKYKEKRRADGTQDSSARAARFYDKSDVQDHNKSTVKTAQKYKEKEQADKAERTQILEMGTEGVERKRKEALGIKTSTASQSGVANKSKVSKSGIKKGK
jgi:hypothetical protein